MSDENGTRKLVEVPTESPTRSLTPKEIRELEPVIFKGVQGAHKISPDQRYKLASNAVVAITSLRSTQTKMHSGPIPSPEDMEKYNGVISNGAERIMKMAEEQSAHRMSLETDALKGHLIESKRGQLIGFAVVVLCLVASFCLTREGHDVVGGIIGGSTVVSLAGAFIYGKYFQTRDLKQKRDANSKTP